MDDVTFSYHWANGPESNTPLCLEEVRQVAVSVGHQTTTVISQVHQNAAPGRSLLSTIVCLVNIYRAKVTTHHTLRMYGTPYITDVWLAMYETLLKLVFLCRKHAKFLLFSTNW